jgi:hypothetical protein
MLIVKRGVPINIAGSLFSSVDFVVICKKLEKESVVCQTIALFLENRFRWQTTDHREAHQLTHPEKRKTRQDERLLRKAAVKTTGVESLCSATPRIHRVPRIVVSLVNFKR